MVLHQMKVQMKRNTWIIIASSGDKGKRVTMTFHTVLSSPWIIVVSSGHKGKKLLPLFSMQSRFNIKNYCLN